MLLEMIVVYQLSKSMNTRIMGNRVDSQKFIIFFLMALQHKRVVVLKCKEKVSEKLILIQRNQLSWLFIQ